MMMVLVGIPTEICLDIFSRLPMDSLIQCKHVCKSWRALLKDPSLPDMHTHRLLNTASSEHDSQVLMPTCLLSLSVLPYHSMMSRLKEIYYGDYVNNEDSDGNEEDPGPLLPRFRVTEAPISGGSWTIIGSAKGLICLVSSSDSYSRPHIDIYVSNPCTRECVHLPRIHVHVSRYFMAWGFGWHPSTKEFKVVAITCSLLEDEWRHAQVYTLGSGGGGVWRDKGYIHPLYNVWTNNVWRYTNNRTRTCVGTLAEGRIYWISKDAMKDWPRKDEVKIVSFDIADEELRITPSPPPIRTSTIRNVNGHCPDEPQLLRGSVNLTYFCELQVLGGCLSLVKHCHCYENNVWQGTHGVWVKNKDKDSWTKKFTPPWRNDNYKLLGYLNSNNKVLMLYSDVIDCSTKFKFPDVSEDRRPVRMRICDLKTGKTEAIDIIRSRDYKKVFDNDLVKSFEIFPYEKSFVSPNAL